MVRRSRLALRTVDRLLLGYLGLITLVVLARGWATPAATARLLLLHAVLAALVLLCAGLDREAAWGRWLHDFYPLALLIPLYSEFGALSAQVGRDAVLAHDAQVQTWEAAIFGGQPSYEWIRRAPSVFWSGLLHLAYFSYYPIIILGPTLLAVRGRRDAARRVILATMVAYLSCYVVFALFPVAGPYFAFPRPTGPVREVWSARLIYRVLSQGSSFGSAFPSSHVAATLAATLAVWSEWRALGWSFALPCALLTVGTVYCQMHYAIDATSGMLVGLLSWWGASNVARVSGHSGDSSAG
jgi:membrane-associated phospholipid phosphatase